MLRLLFRCASLLKRQILSFRVLGPAPCAGRSWPFAALPPLSRATLPLYLQCLFTFVVAVDLTVAASDVKMAGKNNKTEGFRLAPRDFLTDKILAPSPLGSPAAAPRPSTRA